jgi:hypothetical protein
VPHPVKSRGLRITVLLIVLYFFVLKQSSPASKNQSFGSLEPLARPLALGPQSEVQRANEQWLLAYITEHPSVYSTQWYTDSVEARHELLPVTAIVLAWKRPRGLAILLRSLGAHPFIREIIVWNNNNMVHLELDVRFQLVDHEQFIETHLLYRTSRP